MAESASPPSRFRGQALPARVLSGVFLAALVLGAAWTGGLAFTLLVALVLLIALGELLRLAGKAGYCVLRAPAFAAVVAVVALTARPDALLAGAVGLALSVWMVGASLRPPIAGRIHGLAMTFFGVFYVAGGGAHILKLRQLPNGWNLLLLVLLGTWAADTCAFFVGVRWGKRPLAPHLSPKKSVEGFLGGLAGSVVVVTGAAWVLVPEMGLLFPALVGCVVGAAAPLGDLLESLIKRNLNAKDMSQVIPGHGGVLDRIDSVLLAGPAAYYLFRVFGS